jgi:3-oxoadipyl-CoA thiolase
MKQQYGVDSMPETGENVAEEFQVKRADQDAFAVRSQQRAGKAIASGFFDQEIVPVETPGGKAGPIVVDKDEHPRPDTTLESLAKLKTPFRNPGTVTAGNASGVNDGAAALILASEAAAKKHGLKARARVLGMASAGVPPRIMGIGPVSSTRKLMERLSLKISNFDVIELNEAFASQSLAVMRQLGLSDDASQVNPHGGAIALGHPLGMSGARLAGTAMRALEARDGRLGLATMCVGVGQGCLTRARTGRIRELRHVHRLSGRQHEGASLAVLCRLQEHGETSPGKTARHHAAYDVGADRPGLRP